MSYVGTSYQAESYNGPPPSPPTAPTLAVLDRQQTSLVLRTSDYAGPGTHGSTTLEGRLKGAVDWDTLVVDETKSTGDLLTFSLTGLTAGTTYEFRALHATTAGVASAFGAVLEVRTKTSITEFQETDNVFILKTPIAGEGDGDPVDIWPDTGPNAYTGLPAVTADRPTYRTDDPCTGIAVLEFDGDDFLEDTVAGPSQIPNVIRDGPLADFTFICSVRHTGASNGTIFGCYTFGGDNIVVIQTLASPSRFRVLRGGADDFIFPYTPRGGGDMDVFAVTYEDATRTVKCWHFDTFLGEGTFSTPLAFANTHWVTAGQDRDPLGESEHFLGDMNLQSLWRVLMSDSAREDNTEHATDTLTCGGSGGGSGACVAPVLEWSRAENNRVDVRIVNASQVPANHDYTRWRVKQTSDDAIVLPSDGSPWIEDPVNLLGRTLSPLPRGVELYIEAEVHDGDAGPITDPASWCGIGASTPFTILARPTTPRVPGMNLFRLGPEAAGA